MNNVWLSVFRAFFGKRKKVNVAEDFKLATDEYISNSKEINNMNKGYWLDELATDEQKQFCVIYSEYKLEDLVLGKDTMKDIKERIKIRRNSESTEEDGEYRKWRKKFNERQVLSIVNATMQQACLSGQARMGSTSQDYRDFMYEAQAQATIEKVNSQGDLRGLQ